MCTCVYIHVVTKLKKVTFILSEVCIYMYENICTHIYTWKYVYVCMNLYMLKEIKPLKALCMNEHYYKYE